MLDAVSTLLCRVILQELGYQRTRFPRGSCLGCLECLVSGEAVFPAVLLTTTHDIAPPVDYEAKCPVFR